MTPPFSGGPAHCHMLRLLIASLCILRVFGADWHHGPNYRYLEFALDNEGRSGFTRIPGSETGIGFTNFLSDETVARNRVTENGSGVALGDIDGDGLCDIYFCRLEGDNVLYRNLGNWKFEDVTASAGVACPNQFSTGAVFADVDGDGDLDLLVNSIGGGTREFINDGKGHFTEREKTRLVRRFGSTSMALADIDGNGSLDLYVANYRTSTYKDDIPPLKIEAKRVDGKIVVTPADRVHAIGVVGGNVAVSEIGERDFLYVNTGNGNFAPVSWTNGNFLDEDGAPLPAPHTDWGLTAMFRDMNGDMIPDLIVCNDFFYSPDRIFLSQGAGKFRLISLQAMRKCSLASMSVDFADIDRDGYDDFLVVEMLAREHFFRQTHRDNLDRAKSNTQVTDRNWRTEIPRNTLFHNRGNGTYAEIAEFAGLDATDWSWGALFVDIDLDGYEDLIVPTGNNHDVQNIDILKTQERSRGPDSIAQRTRFLKELGMLSSEILAFRNKHDLTFEERGQEWGFSGKGIFNGAALADLDNDGDLDLVVNCLNGEAAIYRNQSTGPRIEVRLRSRGLNTQGIGARLKVSGGPVTQTQQIVAGGRYCSGDDPSRVFAAKDSSKPLSVEVWWQDGTYDRFDGLKPNRIYELQELAGQAPPPPTAKPSPFFEDASELLHHTHTDEPFNDFERQPLLPAKLSQLGPGISWFDWDGDGWDDLIIPSGRGGSLALLRNTGQGGFTNLVEPVLSNHASSDQTAVLGWRSGTNAWLLAGSANYETGLTRIPSVQVMDQSTNRPEPAIPGNTSSTGALAMADIDGEGDLALFVAGRVIGGRYPEAADSRLFKNRAGKFVPDEANSSLLQHLGLATGAIFSDINGDGAPDLLVATEWGSIHLFVNTGGHLTDATSAHGLNQFTGIWTGIAAGDFDGDGRMDFVAGNWGLNCKYRRYSAQPIQLYYGDVDKNGTVDLLEAIYDPSLKKIVPWQDLDTLQKAMPFLGERFQSYAQFSVSSVQESLPPNPDVKVLLANTLASTVFLNRGDKFEAHPLPAEAQFAPVFGVAVADLDGDGNEDILLAQNQFDTSIDQFGLDAGIGLWLRGDGHGNFHPVSVLESGIAAYGQQRGLALCDYDHDGRVDIAMGQNSAPTKLFHNKGAKAGVLVRLHGPVGNPQAIGAIMQVEHNGRLGPAREIHCGSGYWSQDSATQVLAASAGDKLVIRWPGGKTSSKTLGNETETELWP